MTKTYKVKEINKTKLKAYLKDGVKTTSKGNRGCTHIKFNNPKRSNI